MWFRKKHKEPINPFSYHESGFSINEKHVYWNDISKIVAYKEDLVAIDRICIRIELETNIAFTAHEDLDGYNEFIQKLEENVEIRPAWFLDVAFPAFERNETVIYEKSKISFNQ